MSLLSNILVLLSLVGCCTCNTYHVNSSSDLEQYLCNTTWSSQHLIFLLNSSVNFTISPGNFCRVTTQLKKNSKIEIRGDSLTKPTTITCVHDDKQQTFLQPRRGLVFFNSQVTLKQLVFKNCGTYLTTIKNSTISNYFNSSSLYYTSSHAAALVFVHCQVNITQVNIYYSYGFAMIGVNLYNSTIDSVSMSNSSYGAKVYHNKRQSIGCGFLLHYMDTNNAFQEKESVLQVSDIYINDTSLSYNIDYNSYSCITDNYYNKHLSSSSGCNPIVNAAGLTILYAQQNSSQVSVHITKSYFNDNNGSFVGGIFILKYNTNFPINISISHTIFNANNNNNSLQCHGAALAFYWFSMHATPVKKTLSNLYILNTSFDQSFNQTYASFTKNSGAVYIGIDNHAVFQLHVSFIDCTFRNNYVTNIGACLYASVYQFAHNKGFVSIKLKSTIAVKNSQNTDKPLVSSAGIFYFYRINRVDITGKSLFSNNYGSVISSQDSNVHLSGNLTFNNNHAMTGPAIRLVGNCQLYFMSGVIAKFTDNSAQLMGGAIYADGTQSNDKCVIQINSSVSQILFSNNEAKRAGSSIYAQPISSCYINNTNSIKSPEEIMTFYKQHFTFNNNKSNTNLYQFSTLPQSLKEVTGILPHYDKIFPGQKFHYCISAIDALHRNVFTTLAIVIITNHFQPNISDTSKVWLDFRDQEQLIQEGINCTKISVAVHTNDKVNIIGAMIVFSQYSQTNILSKSVHIYPCPLGFDLKDKKGVCELSSSFNNLMKHKHISVPITGNITSQMITRPLTTNVWAGIMKNGNKSKGAFGVSNHCPVGFCNNDKTLAYFYSGDLSPNRSFKLSDGITNYHPPLCLYQREGTLCGRCSEGLSVVFGSTECHHCSNAWIATIIIYLVAGPLLIYLLFALRLTLATGIFNGIIFYVQAANMGILDMLSVYNGKMGVFRDVIVVFLSILNLGLGFPLCFYNGMTELLKAGLSLLFPLYLLTIVVVLIILSHFSLRLSNKIAQSSVQVLVTVVHLSYGRLLGAIIYAFTPSIVFTSEQTYHVWYWDGSVEYGNKGHIILIAITSLVVFPLLLPYVFLLLFVKSLRHWKCVNEYTRPILEAIHAPYKNGRQYWFVARLLLLIMMYILYSIEPYAQVIYIVIASILVLFIIGQAMFRPYKSNFINLLDCWLLFNLAFVYISTWYEGHMEVTVYSIVPILLFFLTIFMVMVYHILLITRQLKKVQRKVNDICTRVSLYLSGFNQMHKVGNQKSHLLPLQDPNDTFYDSCDNFREPILGSS